MATSSDSVAGETANNDHEEVDDPVDNCSYGSPDCGDNGHYGPSDGPESVSDAAYNGTHCDSF